MSELDAVPDNALHRLGWAEDLDLALRAHDSGDLVAGRVARAERGASHLVLTSEGPVSAHVAGALMSSAIDATALPAVGDWVALRRANGTATIEALLPRRSAFVRGATGTAAVPQVLAANVDFAFIVVALSSWPRIARLERFLALAWESGATPVVLLTKADLAADVDAALEAVSAAAIGVSVHAMSAVTGVGLEALDPYLDGRSTLALLGVSGVGKSTLVNRLVGEPVMATREIRADGKGRHATTHRELIALPQGGALIDTPGLRGLMLWDNEDGDGVDQVFADVVSLAEECRFADCAHVTEPDCAVLAAIEDGTLPARRLDSYRHLQRELAALAARRDARLRAAQRREWKIRAKASRAASVRPGR